MSSFNKENNNINDERGEDTSFYSFLAGILILFVIHYFIKIYRRVFYKVKFDDENKYLNCHCSKCEERFKKYRLKIKSQNINIYLIFRILDFSVILSFFILCCIKVRNNDKERFDPFEILEISESSTLSEIKKSYKQLSLKYHPDKNPNNKEAKEKFMIVNKAYRALTNEKAKENFKKYGNPDGPGLISYGLALPFFLLEGKVGTYVLIIFSISMIIIFPLLFIRWFQNSKRYMYFRSDGYIDAGSRFRNIPNRVPFTDDPKVAAQNYINAVKEGIKDADDFSGNDEDFNKLAKKANEIKEEKASQIAISTIKEDEDEKRNELFEHFKELLKSAGTKQKNDVVNLVKEWEYTTKDLETKASIEELQQLISILEENNFIS